MASPHDRGMHGRVRGTQPLTPAAGSGRRPESRPGAAGREPRRRVARRSGGGATSVVVVILALGLLGAAVWFVKAMREERAAPVARPVHEAPRALAAAPAPSAPRPKPEPVIEEPPPPPPPPTAVPAAVEEPPPPPPPPPTPVAAPEPPKPKPKELGPPTGPLPVKGELGGGRFAEFTQKAARGPKMKVAAATYFGTDGVEEFVDGEALPDGSIVAFGNAWGPQFPTSPRPVVLGSGRHQGLKAVTTDSRGRTNVGQENPDVAGMIVVYDSKLSKILRVARFDWGVASISTGMVSGDGKGLLISGRAQGAFRSALGGVRNVTSDPNPGGKGTGPYAYEGVQCPGDVHLMRLDAATFRPEWALILEGYCTPPQNLWTDDEGAVYFESKGFRKVPREGGSVKHLMGSGFGGQCGVRCLNPVTKYFYYGGDRNTNTGREPWRQPYCYEHDATGAKKRTMWEWSPKGLRDGQGPDEGLVSDSAIRTGAIALNGDIIFTGWSDGGNSVFHKMPTDLHRGVPKPALGMSNWGMKAANSLAWIMRLDPKTLDTKCWTLWLSYVPTTFASERDRGAPNFANVDRVIVLKDGSIAFSGANATGLIQTPNAFVQYVADGRKYGGKSAVVLSEDMTSIMFSSYMPGCESVGLGPTKDGVVFVSRTKGDDGQDPVQRMPVVNAVQSEKKGPYDAHIVLLTLP